MKLYAIAITGIIAIQSVAATGGNNFTRRCSRLLETFKAPNTNVLWSGYTSKGTNVTYPNLHPTCGQNWVVAQANMCRLSLNVTTSSTSNVIMEVWMPEDWETSGKRFAMTGNGGVGGCFALGDLAFTTSLGFTTVGHNNGHDGLSAAPFLNRPEVIKDFAWRATLIATQVGKAATNFFYQTPLAKSYYWGCSGGGRQGMKIAQDFPEEYDGIIAANPAADFHRLIAGALYFGYQTGPPTYPTWLSFEQWLAVDAEVLAQCDTIDGVADLVLEDPLRCHPRFESMLCGQLETWTTHRCLTAAQVSAVEKIYSPVYGNKGRFVAPAFQPGNDQVFGFYLVYGAPSDLGVEYIRYAVKNDATWNLPGTVDEFLEIMDDLLDHDPYKVSANNPNLTPLKTSGHKLLVYHGTSDGYYSHENTIRLYENTAKNMTLKAKQLDDFYRLFPISGLHHCNKGNGAWYFGGPSQHGLGISGVDPNDSLIMKMVRWVENGEAPDTVRGHHIDPITGKPTGAVRDHCRHPFKNTYKGSGDPLSPESWECRLGTKYP
ncbi:Tannase and feruloyl esterase [Orbilia javanica]|uniref:Carboxylic ester hydrolase n=1 Tax=Orbilia javanica TaxID=47235 RepID=A0AAN8P303_9PEZI